MPKYGLQILRVHWICYSVSKYSPKTQQIGLSQTCIYLWVNLAISLSLSFGSFIGIEEIWQGLWKKYLSYDRFINNKVLNQKKKKKERGPSFYTLLTINKRLLKWFLLTLIFRKFKAREDSRVKRRTKFVCPMTEPFLTNLVHKQKYFGPITDCCPFVEQIYWKNRDGTNS